MSDFLEFPKIHRYSRPVIITEKIDGTNGQIFIDEDGSIFVGSRTRWITEEQDNFGFAKWVKENKEELLKLGPGRHFGEWWGSGIQRRYELKERRFSLFNTTRWFNNPDLPKCCHVVPIISMDEILSESLVLTCLDRLKVEGSFASPGFMKPEGIVIYHTQGNVLFKKTIEKDDLPKSNNG